MSSGSIRSRISMTLLIFSMLAALALATTLILMEDQLEATIMDTAFNGQLAYLEGATADALGVRQVEHPGFQAYMIPPEVDAASVLPAWLEAKSTGFHEAVSHGERRYDLTIRQSPQGRIVLATDVTEIEAAEAEFAFVAILCSLAFVCLAWLAARLLAGNLVGPIQRLAERIDQLDPALRYQELPAEQPDPALRRISAVFNNYLQRIDAFVEREQNLTNMASHELRTPLAVISGAVDVLLLREADNPANSKTLGRIKQATSRMAESIDTLLEMSREVASSALVHEPVALDQLLQEVMEEQRSLIGEKPIHFELQVENALHVRAPARLLAILASNLVSNALRYTEEGEVLVRLRGRTLEVIDTGPGMHPEDLPELLRPGRRGPAQTGSGGFGLFIVQSICQRFDWHWQIEARTPRGTLARVHFSGAKGADFLTNGMQDAGDS